MAAFPGTSKGTELSKAEYLKRYLSGDDDSKRAKGKKKRRKIPEKGLKIVDDDIDWKQMNTQPEVEVEEDEEAPVIAEVIDDRPEAIKQLEAFRTSNKWRTMGADEKEVTEEVQDRTGHSPVIAQRTRHDSPEPNKRTRHDSPDAGSFRETQGDSSIATPPRKGRHDSPDLSPERQHKGKPWKAQSKDSHRAPLENRARNRHGSGDSDQSPPRKKLQKGGASDSDQSPPRKQPGKGSDSDLSPLRRRPRNGQERSGSPEDDNDLSPPRRPGPSQSMLSGGQAGLVSIEVLRKEQEENRRREKNNHGLEVDSRDAQTVFRKKDGKRRDLDLEREEQKRKAGEKAAKDEKYSRWGKGMAQTQMHQQKIADAIREVQKPLARHCDDEDLDRMLREQERDGDPMAAMLRRKKERTAKLQGVKEKPRYKGPAPPPNRFNIPPGYRWDGVDRSNGFEQKRYTRISDAKAVEEVAYKWSVEDM